ncbi:MAG TPA: Ig-like domain-containing protein, partial [Candidatus Obscuribacterales bacterium]
MACQPGTGPPNLGKPAPVPTPVKTAGPASPSATPPATPVPSPMPTHQGDTSRPLVNFTFPQPGASQVAVNAKLAVTFSELMDPASLNSGSFSLTGPDAQPVAGFVTYAGSVATFTPSAQLQAN